MEEVWESEQPGTKPADSCEDSALTLALRLVTKTQLKVWTLPALLLLLLLIHVSLGLRIPRVFHGDEVWTINRLMSNYGQLLLHILKGDNHPPLYYLLSKGWIEITGATIPALRWLSFLFTSLTLSFLAWNYRRHPRLEMAFVMGLIGTNPLLTYYSATVRPYSLVVLLATVMTWSALMLKRNHPPEADLPIQVEGLITAGNLSSRRAAPHSRGWTILYYGSALLLSLTHYFGTLYVFLATCFDLLSRRIERSPWKAILLILLIITWPLLQILTGTLDKQAEANSWVNVFPLISTFNNFLAGVFPLLIISRMPQLAFAMVLALVLLLLTLRPVLQTARLGPGGKRGWLDWLPTSDTAFLLVVVSAVVAAGCVADALLPFTTPYYFLVCLPAVTILLGRLLTATLRDRYSRGLCLLLTVAIVALQIQMAHQRLSLP
jgi:uncharacterized membrane protein